MRESFREIPFNYTSADDRLIVTQLLGAAFWEKLELLRARRVTGRSARLLARVFGDVFIHRRNAYLLQALIDSPRRRGRLFKNLETDLGVVEANAEDDPVVRQVLAATRALVEEFRRDLAGASAERRRVMAALGPIVGRQNVCFDPFTLVSHATDATDWRLRLPLAVVMPTEESQVAPLLRAIGDLGLGAIPRGAGTGLTGGAVPLRPGCILINTEKLNRILGIEQRELPAAGARARRAHVMAVQAGVVTERAIEEATRHGLVFATDPTSAWACTIGGNIAENAGGKTAVLWGTCIDNLLSWRVAVPSGLSYTVRRLDHRMRKIHPADWVCWELRDSAGVVLRTIKLRGDEIRRPGLWKDITNKALGGLPGLQKEGTDGVITSAEFVLYPRYEASATLCLEFFGPDMDEASQVILEVTRALPDRGEEALQALEHFDDEYVRAIDYKVKAPRAKTPKAVLLIDVVGHTPEQVARGVENVRAVLLRHGNTELFVAEDAAEAQRFWADRKQLGAIAARTNAFKLNEDVVLPLTALAEFSRFCAAVNAHEERENQLELVRRLKRFLAAAASGEEGADGVFLAEKIPPALLACEAAELKLRAASPGALRELALLGELKREMLEYLRGHKALVEAVDGIWQDVRSRRIVIATHMHAGDGNVHVNIPVMSNDRAMMQRAEHVVDQVMAEVARLGGVCSGEHGIGVTKLKYLDQARVDALDAHRREIDPRGVMNPGKVSDRALTALIFTPSFNLLELEARILQHGKLEQLALKIASCIRCGKCKPDCCVFHPGRGLFFHPRNKNLAVGALIEALLYESQRDRSDSFELLGHLEEVAEHCTICHKCLKPCPVNIDTGEVSVLEREILAARKRKRARLATRATLRYLDSQSPAFNAAFRTLVLRCGGGVQRALASTLGPSLSHEEASSAYPLQLLRSAGPRPDSVTLRGVLPVCEADQALVVEPEQDIRANVLYFPGCGSERLYGSVALAALHVLLEIGARTVLPPPFLCCGFPAWANAAAEQHGRQALRDMIVFSQIREMLLHLSFDAVVVTCGTCHDSLGAMEVQKIFDAPLLDLTRFANERGLRVTPSQPRCFYHTPCHDPLQGKADTALAGIGGYQLRNVPHCCSEAGTLALSRPDIADAMLHRKRGAFSDALAEENAKTSPVVLTSCPSCLSGLGRNASMGLEPRHVAVELARAISGEGWLDKVRTQASRAHAIHF